MKLKMRLVVVGILALASIITAIPTAVHPVFAQTSPRSPDCQMWSNPQVATGGTVTLSYTVGYLPTTITITADDSSATPPGTPTVGAPDTTRADSLQQGSIVTGVVTERTVFTMRVSNAQGSRTCTVTVPFNAAPEGSLRLPLVATLIDLPDTMVYPGPTAGNQNIQAAAYSNGTFAFSGACGGPKDQTYMTSAFFRQGGAWFFKDDGTLIAERDLCMDGGTIAQSLFMHGGAMSQMIADGDRGFFMAVRSHAGSAYGPMAKHAGYYQVAGGNVLFTPSSNFIVRDVDDFAAANGKVIGDVEVGLDGGSGKNVTLSTPSLQILAEREANSVRPIVGFGDYVLGRATNPTGACSLLAGAPPTVFRVGADGSLTSVQTLTLPDGLCPGKMAIDYTTSPKRLAVTSNTGQSGRNLNYSNRIFLFTSGANGLEPAGEMQIPNSALSEINRPDFATFPAFAVGGSYLAIAGKPGDVDDEYLTLWRDGTLVGVAQAPLRRQYGPIPAGEAALNPSHLFITPQGRIMAASHEGAYLFGTTGGGVTPPPPPPGPSSTTLSQIPGQAFNVYYGATSTAPSVLIRMANILSVGASSLNISIFGRAYSVDATGAQVVGSSWLPISLSTFSPGGFTNVWGTLDMANSAIIHAIRIRNPLPAGVSGQFSTSFSAQTSFPSTAPTVAPSAAATAATQTQLNVLQQALRALQLRLAQ